MTASATPSPKFRRRASERPDELLDAALALFAEKGYAHSSVAEIARRAGVSKGAVYLYFPSKQAILEALVRRAVSPVAERAVAAAELGVSDLRTSLRAALGSVARALSDPRVFAVPKLVMREAVVAPEIASMYRRAVFDSGLPAITHVIEQGVASGELRPVDPELTVRSLIGPIVAHVLLAEVFGVVPERGLALDALIDNHLDILINGLFTPKALNDA